MSCVLKGMEPGADVQSDPYAPPPSVREACLALKEFYCSSPKHFVEDSSIALVSGEYSNHLSFIAVILVFRYNTST